MVGWSARLPPLRHCYARYYHAAVGQMSRELAVLPGVLSLLSRNSYADRTFTPALSDIDVALVIQDGLPPARVKVLLQELDALFASLRPRFPMLGEFPVYTREGFVTACRLGPMSLETYAWRCEWGDNSVLQALQDPAGRSSLEVLSRGIQVYINGFHGNLQAAIAAGRRNSSLAMERSVKKMERELGAGTSPARGSLEEVLAGALANADQAVSAYPLHGPAHGLPLVDNRHGGELRIVNDGEPPAQSSLQAIISRLRGNHAWYVLAPGWLEKGPGHALALAQAGLSASRPFTILTAPMLIFFLRHLSPLTYYQLQSARAVAGEDMLSLLPEPSASGFLRFFRFEVMHLLKLTSNLERRARAEPKLLHAHTLRLQRLRHFVEHQEISLKPQVTDDGTSGAASVEGVIQNMYELIDMMRHNTDVLMDDDQVVMT